MLSRPQRAVRQLERQRCRLETAAHRPEVAIHVGGRRQLPDVGRVIRRAERSEDTVDDRPSRGAEVCDEPGGRRPPRAVVVGDHGDRPPAVLPVDVLAETGVPLRGVAVVAEDVAPRDLHRRLLGGRRAEDDRLARMRPGPLRGGDRLVARGRPDEHVRVLLDHEPVELAQDRLRAAVAAAGLREHESRAADDAAPHLRERGLRAGERRFVARGERSPAVRENRDPNLLRRRRSLTHRQADGYEDEDRSDYADPPV